MVTFLGRCVSGYGTGYGTGYMAMHRVRVGYSVGLTKNYKWLSRVHSYMQGLQSYGVGSTHKYILPCRMPSYAQGTFMLLLRFNAEV